MPRPHTVPAPLPSHWAIHPDRFHALLPRLTDFTDALALWWEMDEDEEEEEAKKPYTVKDGVARLDLKGPLVKEGGFWTWWLGGTSLLHFASLCAKCAEDEDVSEVLVVFDTPGGTLDGTPFAAEALKRLSGAKKVKGHIDGCCCSAGYWIAASIPQGSLTANPESDVANVGIYTTVTDVSAALKEQGIERILVATGKYKGAGVWGVEVTEAHKEQFRSMVEAPFELFKKAVREGRDLSTKAWKEVSEGFVYMAENAIELGLVDRVGYMQNGVPPSADSPDTTPEGDPPAPPDDDEEQSNMNEEEKAKSLLQTIAGWFSKNGQATSAPPPPGDANPTLSGENTQPLVNHGSQPIIATIQPHEAATELQGQLRAAQTELETLRAQVNDAKINEYMAAGFITPAQREAQSKLRLANPDLYDTTMSGLAPHVAMGGGEAETPAENSVTALSLLQQYQAEAKQDTKIAPQVNSYLEANQKAATNGNALTKLKGGR
jgi:capsid assembly protease